MVPKPASRARARPSPRGTSRSHEANLSPCLLASALVLVLIATRQWARRWLYSGCTIESLLILYDYGTGRRVFSRAPTWTLLATFNLAYSISATSWLLYAVFAALCWPTILVTCLLEFQSVADLARRSLRRMLRQLHFTKDKVALFDLPALEIDTDVDGLLVIRGVTISMSTLTLVAHGIELGITARPPGPSGARFAFMLTFAVGVKLADEVELAMFADEVTVNLFRGISIKDVYGNVKGGKVEMTFAELEGSSEGSADDDDSVLLNDTPLLRAATAGSTGFKDRPKLRESLTGVSYIKDSSARAGLDSITTLSPNDAQAEKEYLARLDTIKTTTPVYQSRAQVRMTAKQGTGFIIDKERDLKAAICAELHALPSVPHPPERSVRVTTLQTLAPHYVRRFLHRLPLLYRLLLAPISYLHPVEIASISAAGSGRWLSVMLQQNIFKHYAASNAGLRRLQKKVGTWLADANFCVQLNGMEASGHVPVSSLFDIVAYLDIADIIAYRTTLSSGIAEVVRVGGMDAVVTVPSFLLPHHEHILPPLPTRQEEEELADAVADADGHPQAVKAEDELDKVVKDETTVKISAHVSLPASLDQSLLGFVAALVKASKIIELEKQADESGSAPTDDDLTSPMSPSFDSDASSRPPSPVKFLPGSPTKDGTGLKSFARTLRQNLRDGNATQNIRDFAKDLQQSTQNSMKRAVIGGFVNDRWIAKAVWKIAAKLEKAQGDFGYSGAINVPLGPYRGTEELPSKLLP